MRESVGFREELENLRTVFPSKNYLSIKDVADYLGCSVNTAKKRYPFIRKTKGASGCSAVALARELSK